MRPDDPPSLLTPLTPIVLAMRALATLGLAVPASRVLGRMARGAILNGRGFRRYSPLDGDVIVSTFPKSGTNWMLQIGQQIAWRGEAEFEHIHSVVPWPDAPTNRVVSLEETLPPSPTGHRIIKTHFGAHATPWQSGATCIVVVRDPKEVVVSSYHFVVGLLGLLDRISPDEWLELFLSQNLPFGTWPEHAASWWPLRDHANVLLFEFGAMKKDLPGHVDRVAAAMGVRLDATERAQVLERAGFAWMKAHESQFAPPPLPAAGVATRPLMIRKGEAGHAGEMLSQEQQARVDRHCRAELLRLGCDLPYDEWFDTVD